MRGSTFAKQFFQDLDLFVPTVDTKLLAHLRVEAHLLDKYDKVAEFCRRHKIFFVVFNDYLPSKVLSAGEKYLTLRGRC